MKKSVRILLIIIGTFILALAAIFVHIRFVHKNMILDGPDSVYTWTNYQLYSKWVETGVHEGRDPVELVFDADHFTMMASGTEETFHYSLPEGTDIYGKPEGEVYLVLSDCTEFQDLFFHEEHLDNGEKIPVLSATTFEYDGRGEIVIAEFVLAKDLTKIPADFRSTSCIERNDTVAGMSQESLTEFQESDAVFTPDTITMNQPLSSRLPPEAITDPETVQHLWDLYQSFSFDGTAETIDKNNVWSIYVTFINSKTGETEHFSIHQGGLCILNDDFKTFHVLIDGADIYKEFLRCMQANQSLFVATEADISTPPAVIDYAVDYIRQTAKVWSTSVYEGNGAARQNMPMPAKATITDLTQISTGTAGLNSGISMYRLAYNFTSSEDGTTAAAREEPYLLLHWENTDAGQLWLPICVTYGEVIEQKYNTPEMLEQYGNMYTAAAMELYAQYTADMSESESGTPSRQTEVLHTASIKIAPATDELLSQYPDYDEIDAAIDEYGLRLLITADRTLHDFYLIRLEFDEGAQQLIQAENGELYHAAELTPDRPLLTCISFPGVLPTVGFSYVDTDGNTKSFHIIMSGEDGSVLLQEAPTNDAIS